MRQVDPDAAAMFQDPDSEYAPAAEEWHTFFWNAWACLRGDRQYGPMGGQSPISFMAFDRYAERYGLTGTDFDFFLRMMMEIDAEYLEWISEQIEAEQKQARANK